MKKRLYYLILAFGVVIFSGFAFSTFTLPAVSATDVSGIINTDTVWAIGGSPYHLTGNVQVSDGITLTIEPGVTIMGNGFNLDTWGKLIASGSNDSPVIFENTHIRPAQGNDPGTPFRIEIAFAEINGGSIYEPTGGTYGSLQLTDSVIRNTNQRMYLWYPVDDILIERNIFFQARGISCGAAGTITITIRNNVFFEQTLNGYGDPAIENWVLYDDSSLVVEFNSFLSTDRVAVGLEPGHDNASMLAENNYWNTDDETVIESMIFDRNDDLAAADYIDYVPYLTAPHPDTPTIDFIAPASINDLVASTGSEQNTVNLSWTAPGDDGNAGTASNYTVRYSTSVISSEVAWEAATDVSNEPTPSPAGTNETMIVNELVAGQNYYFAIRTNDELGNLSGLSNSPSAFVGVNLIEGVYLPVIIKPAASPPQPTENVQITDIFYDGLVPRVESDEYAEIANHGGQTTNLAGWRLNAGEPGQDFWFPSFNLTPGQSCRVYTNEIHPQYCGFSFGSGQPFWNNVGDCGHLYNASGKEVSTFCY